MAYTYSMSISAQASAIGSNETDFPVALVLTSANLKTVANGGHVENTDASGGASGSLTVPADFVVSPNSDGSSPPDFEVVDFDASTGYIELWVEISSLSSYSDTEIFLCYGDDGVTTSQEDVAGTWGNGYVSAWHLSESANSTVYDSVGNNDSNVDSFNSVSGQVGGAAEFVDADSDRIEFADSASFDVSAITLAAWVKIDTWTDEDKLILRDDISSNRIFQLYSQSSDEIQFLCSTTNATFDVNLTTDGANLATGTWYYVTATYDSSNDAEVRVDGVSHGTDGATGDVLTGATKVVLGASHTTTERLDGKLDEVRYSSTRRDADWILTSFNNQDDPTPSSTFWGALGSEQGGAILGQMLRGMIG